MSYKGDRDASLEALRCIANALLLVESSRETFLKSPVNGGDFCLNALEACKFNCSPALVTIFPESNYT